MKFGRDLHRHRVPQWAGLYIDYNSFKSELKLGNAETEKIQDIAKAVRRSADGADAFYLRQADLLRKRLDALTDDQTLKPLLRHAELFKLLHETQKLKSFGHVNATSLGKLRYKADAQSSRLKPGPLDSSRYHFVSQRECAALQARIRNVLSGVDPGSIEQELASLTMDEDQTPSSLSSLLTAIGYAPLLHAGWGCTDSGDDLTNFESLVELSTLIDNRIAHQPIDTLWKRDLSGRVLLHYAAEAGSLDVCTNILDRLQTEQAPGLTSQQLTDAKGDTPLRLAVAKGFDEIIRTLLASPSFKHVLESPETMIDLVNIALLSFAERPEVLACLLDTCRVDPAGRNSSYETLLFVAARSGSKRCLELLLEQDPSSGRGLNLTVGIRNWTPLIVASVHGHTDIVELLISAGADVEAYDAVGWCASDHAAYRGYLEVATILATVSKSKSLPLRRPPAAQESISTHRREIYVNLGPLNTRDSRPAVAIRPHQIGDPGLTIDQLSISVRAIGATGSSSRLSLPLLEDLTNKPFKLVADSEKSSVTLIFELWLGIEAQTDRGSLVGVAFADLKALKENVAPRRESLVRDYSVPIVSQASMTLIGSVTFNFLEVFPIQSPASSSKRLIGDICKPGQPTVIGHRGFGANNPALRRLQLGENTVLGSCAANALRVPLIEFDVQLTSDHVPIIYHDNRVAETGVDVPPWALTAAQFKFLGEEQKQVDAALEGERGSRSPRGAGKPRSRSATRYPGERLQLLKTRMSKTADAQAKGFKSNVRANEIADSYATLEEFLQQVPEETGFDIELKYPMLWEAQDANMELYGVELNFYIDTILDTIFALAGRRNIFFSSFFPELCVLCSRKQSTYPVLFLSDGGKHPTGDVRASNVQEAVKFATAWGLDGIVLASEPLLLSPKLIRHAQGHGLACLSYGGQNNEPAKAKAQIDAGLDGIAVDEVGLIVRALGA